MEPGLIMANNTQSALALSPAVEGGEFLVRSRGEIRRIFGVISDRQITLSVNIAGAGSIANTTLVFIDDNTATLLLMCSHEWREALDTPQAERIMLNCPIEDASIQFPAGHCTVVDLDGVAVIGITIPEFMWRFQRRRDMHYKIPAAPALKITLNLGFMEAEAEVVDLSMSGVGAVGCGSEVKLDQGEVLCGCSIALPGVGKIAVDLLVQYQTAVSAPDGREVTRVGCQFIGLSDEARDLVGSYLAALAAEE